MKQVYDLCKLCNLFELERCKKMYGLHPLKATIECEDFQPLFEDLYDLVGYQKEKVIRCKDYGSKTGEAPTMPYPYSYTIDYTHHDSTTM